MTYLYVDMYKYGMYFCVKFYDLKALIYITTSLYNGMNNEGRTMPWRIGSNAGSNGSENKQDIGKLNCIQKYHSCVVTEFKKNKITV